MVKSTAFSFRMHPKVKEALEKIAEDDNRSVGSLVEKILMDWLRERGLLEKASPARKR